MAYVSSSFTISDHRNKKHLKTINFDLDNSRMIFESVKSFQVRLC